MYDHCIPVELNVLLSCCRLLLEDSDEDEGDLCRICQMGEESASNPLIQPCRCAGSLQYVHQECIKRWLRSKIGSGKNEPPPSAAASTKTMLMCFSVRVCFSSGTNLEAITTCELCKQKLHLNIDNFDIQELYRTHMQVSPCLTSLDEDRASKFEAANTSFI